MHKAKIILISKAIEKWLKSFLLKTKHMESVKKVNDKNAPPEDEVSSGNLIVRTVLGSKSVNVREIAALQDGRSSRKFTLLFGVNKLSVSSVR